jgi:hypothetical protein
MLAAMPVAHPARADRWQPELRTDLGFPLAIPPSASRVLLRRRAGAPEAERIRGGQREATGRALISPAFVISFQLRRSLSQVLEESRSTGH